MNLLVDGKTVLSATGRNNNTMSKTVWDIRRWKGANARIQVVDKRKGSWGNIGLDHVVFTNEAKANPPPPPAGFDKNSVSTIAKREGLDGKRLQAWVDAMALAQKNRSDVLAPLVAVLGSKNPDWNTVRLVAGNADDRRTRYLEALGKLELAVDYGNLSPGDFMQDGVTFGRRPKLPGDLLLNQSGGLAGVARWGYGPSRTCLEWAPYRGLGQGFGWRTRFLPGRHDLAVAHLH